MDKRFTSFICKVYVATHIWLDLLEWLGSWCALANINRLCYMNWISESNVNIDYSFSKTLAFRFHFYMGSDPSGHLTNYCINLAQLHSFGWLRGQLQLQRFGLPRPLLGKRSCLSLHSFHEKASCSKLNICNGAPMDASMLPTMVAQSLPAEPIERTVLYLTCMCIVFHEPEVFGVSISLRPREKQN